MLSWQILLANNAYIQSLPAYLLDLDQAFEACVNARSAETQKCPLPIENDTKYFRPQADRATKNRPRRRCAAGLLLYRGASCLRWS
jgi:hypothetical protein